MAETLGSIVKEAKRNKYSLTKKLSQDDVVAIWEGASEFVERQMLLQKGTAVPGLGVFTFSKKNIDVGNKKFIIIQRPVFLLSEKLAQTHSLHATKIHTPGQIPIVPLNFSSISNDSPFSRDTVEISIKDIMLALSRALAAKKNIQLDFGKVGRLLINQGKVKMRFFRSFILGLDRSGGMENAFGPDTVGSVLSIMSNPTTTLRLINTAPILPKIVESSGEDVGLSLECTTPRLSVSEGASHPSKLDDSLIIEPDDSVSQRGRRESASTEEKLAPLNTPSSSGHSLVPKPGMLFATKDPALVFSSSSPEEQKTSVRFRSFSEGNNTSSNSKIKHSPSQIPARPSTCSHSGPSGQELCYLCHQRAQRNVPVDVSEDRRVREIFDDHMLQNYRHQKDLVALAKELMAKSNNRAYNKQVASKNLEVAQVQQAKRTTKPSEFHSSYVFTQREATPAKYLKQTEYCGQLDSQVTHVQNQRQTIKQLEEILDKEERIKLSEELARSQKEYNERKVQNTLQYQRALAEQVSLKPLYLYSTSSDTMKTSMHQPLFGVHIADVSSDKREDQNESSKRLLREQLETVAAKHQKAKNRIALEKLEEAEMLKQTWKGLVEDIRADKCHKLERRRGLEKSWEGHAKEKCQRELEEQAYSKKPSRMLVQEQCDKYHRCDQCLRAVGNKGKSNILGDTRYISGSRLIV